MLAPRLSPTMLQQEGDGWHKALHPRVLLEAGTSPPRLAPLVEV